MSGASEQWLVDSERGYEFVDGAMCRSHITDVHLKERLSASGADGEDQCRLCLVSPGTGTADLIAVTDVQRHIMDEFKFRYEPALEAGVPWDDGWQGAEISDPNEVLYELCENAIDSQTFDSLVTLLAEAVLETDWTENRHSSSLDAAYFGWDQFVEDVRTQSRFIFLPSRTSSAVVAPGQRSASFLQELLPYVENSDLGLISTVPAGTIFFRGRLVSDERSELVSAADLGPAPAKLAAVNRMSPEGIAMFYGSATPETAIEEIASHGTKKYARIGGFRSQVEFRVLDLTKNLNMPSPFAMDTRDQNGVFQFFRRFAANVTAPMGPDDNPNLTYIPTQVLTEFFRWVPKTPIDGIKLSSAQNGEDTYVLFFDAERVKDASILVEATPSKAAPESRLLWSDLDTGTLPIALTLDPNDVKTYNVERSVAVTETAHDSR